MNAIEYLKSKGFKVSSDPSTYSSGVWGLRNYTEYGINYDAYCNGYHRAWDLYSYDAANIPAVFDGVVVAGTGDYGNFGGTVVIANKQLGLQVIYGHLKRPIHLKIGQKVKQGQTIGKQGSTNFNNVFMASHLHIQFQKYGYYNEKDFVCHGIDITKIDVTTGQKELDYRNEKATFTAHENINTRLSPNRKAVKSGTLKKGESVNYDRVYTNDNHVWISWINRKNKRVYMAIRTYINGVNGQMWGKIK